MGKPNDIAELLTDVRDRLQDIADQQCTHPECGNYDCGCWMTHANEALARFPEELPAAVGKCVRECKLLEAWSRLRTTTWPWRWKKRAGERGEEEWLTTTECEDALATIDKAVGK
jgi:hypothetical protein